MLDLRCWRLAALWLLPAGFAAGQDPTLFADPLPGTAKLELTRPLDEVMVDGIDKYALRAIEQAAQGRAAKWQTDTSSPEVYNTSLIPYRDRLKTILGAVDPLLTRGGIEDLSTTRLSGAPSPGTQIPEGDHGAFYSIHPIRWQVLEGVTGEGLMLWPEAVEPVGLVVCLPDAHWTPEEFCGADPDKRESTILPRWLADQGLVVIVPTLISREDTFSGNPEIAMTNQTHREWVYRSAFEMGRHVIGYEVQKVLAAVDDLVRFNEELQTDLPIGVAGVGDGALLALHAAALDPRIQAALVCGYFQPREGVWQEPIDRNVWQLLNEFGDAELAGMVAPRSLTIEACAVPVVDGPLPVGPGRRGGAAPGTIKIADPALVRKEFARAEPVFQMLKAEEKLKLVVSGPDGRGPAGSPAALKAFLSGLELQAHDEDMGERLKLDQMPNAIARQQRQVQELIDFTQNLLARSARYRDKVWAGADRSSVETWGESAKKYRVMVWDELIGRLPEPTLPANPRTRKLLDDPAYVGYEVVLDVYEDVIAGGILLLPKDLKPGEKRPVVVCQHGLEGVPMDTIGGPETPGYPPYKAFSAELAKRGFIVYAPQNPYRGHDRFRTLQRKSNLLGRSLFSYILPQHQVTLDWLATLPNVDPERIAFYGLSYGGKTAVRVPPLLEKYCLSICSADYNEWVLKNTSTHDRYSYVFTPEYEIFEWNMGHVANYAELSTLMTPRPFMVERGHDDGVAPDEWVAWEYAKVRRHYAKLGLADKTEIEFFNGPHTINGQGTFEFLHRHLKWAKKSE